MTFTLLHAPGHGGEDVGNTRIDPCERDWVLEQAIRVDQALRAWPIDTHMSRTTNEINPSPAEEAALAESAEVDLCLLYHVDVNDNPLTHGMHVFAKANDPVGLLAGRAMLSACPSDLKGPWIRTISVAPGEKSWPRVWNCLEPYQRPAVLIEFGFASNAIDKRVLEDIRRHPEITVAVLAGVVAAMGAKK